MTTTENHDRDAVIDRVAASTYDLAIIGGGIAGAGVARDAALRGMDTVLVERADFAWGTTAGSSRLAHGGLRYLEQFDFGLVFEGLRERETLAELAPHLVEPVQFVIPQYNEPLHERVKLRLGMILYDGLSFGKTMPNHSRLSPEEIVELEGGISSTGLQGGFSYHDRQIPYPERLTLETLLDAASAGADVLNYAEATALETEKSRVTGVAVADRLGDESFTIDSQAVVNAAGPWADEIVSETNDRSLVRPAKGIHIVVPSISENALTLPISDDRIIFVIPWAGKSLIGTADTPFAGDPGEATATKAEVEYLVSEARQYFPELDPADIMYSYAAVRPLYDSGAGSDTGAVSRKHKVVDHGPDNAGLFSLVGAKITPYRAAAEDATDTVARYLGIDEPCRTADRPLPGGTPGRIRDADMPPSRLDHLQSVYGSRADAVIERATEDETLQERLCPHTEDILAQVTVAVEEEYAERATDVVFRRCTVGFEGCEGRDAIDTVVGHMAALLDWGDERIEAEIDRFDAVLERRHAFDSDGHSS